LTRVVVDASLALAWCFPDEASNYAEGVLVAPEGRNISVPAIWGLEIANALVAGERSKRVRQPEIERFTILLKSLSPMQDMQPAAAHVGNVLPVAHEYSLSAYDAAESSAEGSCRNLRGRKPSRRVLQRLFAPLATLLCGSFLMNDAQTILTAGVPTLAVVVGILVNNSRLTDLRIYVDKRLDDQRDLLKSEIGKLEQMFTILIGKIDELDTRVARLEERR